MTIIYIMIMSLCIIVPIGVAGATRLKKEWHKTLFTVTVCLGLIIGSVVSSVYITESSWHHMADIQWFKWMFRLE